MIFALVSTLLVIWVVMWFFFKFMYPKPPKAFFPKEGDITTPRICDFCGHELAQYRGIVQQKSQQFQGQNITAVPQPDSAGADTNLKAANSSDELDTLAAGENIENEWFFCNAEHQASFHAGETYQA